MSTVNDIISGKAVNITTTDVELVELIDEVIETLKFRHQIKVQSVYRNRIEWADSIQHLYWIKEVYNFLDFVVANKINDKKLFRCMYSKHRLPITSDELSAHENFSRFSARFTNNFRVYMNA